MAAAGFSWVIHTDGMLCVQVEVQAWTADTDHSN